MLHNHVYNMLTLRLDRVASIKKIPESRLNGYCVGSGWVRKF